MKIKNTHSKILLLLLLSAFSASAATWTDSTSGIVYTYTIANNEATITDCDANSRHSTITSLTIPVTLGGCPVVSLDVDESEYGRSACSHLYYLQTITFPSTLRTICPYAFYNCKKLKTAQLPASITEVGDYAFFQCYALTGVNFPASLRRLGFMAYMRTNLASVSLSSSDIELSESLFEDCTNLVSATLPNALTTVPIRLFRGCTHLTSANIPTAATHIGYSCFENCSALSDIAIPSSVTCIDHSAFVGCKSLGEGAIIKNNCLLWYNATSLTSYTYTVPDGVRLIAGEAFRLGSVSCPTFTQVVLPDSCVSIGEYAFRNCKKLKYINLSNVTRIDYEAFTNTGLINSYGYTIIDGCLIADQSDYIEEPHPLDIPEGVRVIAGSTYWCQTLDNVTAINFPSTLKTIGDSAFAYSGLSCALDIPESVTLIDYTAFKDCSNITQVVLHSRATVIMPDAFPASVPIVYDIASEKPAPITVEDCTTWDAYTNAIVHNAEVRASSSADPQSLIPDPSAVTPTTPSPGSTGAGKTHANGVPMTIYDEFVMGTDPTDDESQFTSTITISNNIPVITWSPALNGEGVPTGIRTYTTFGSTNLTDWTALDATHPAANYKFFKVSVSLP